MIGSARGLAHLPVNFEQGKLSLRIGGLLLHGVVEALDLRALIGHAAGEDITRLRIKAQSELGVKHRELEQFAESLLAGGS
jgi:hypothetical protein